MSITRTLATGNADGTVELGSIMSADWSSLQVNIVAANVSGQIVSLPKGAVKSYISPDTSGENWIQVDGAVYSGVARRFKIVKAGVPGTVTTINIGVWRSDDLEANIPAAVFTGSRAMTTQSYREANVKNGSQFNASRRVLAVAGSANLDSAFVTGSVPVILKSRIIGYTGAGVSASIYRAATFTGGTNVTSADVLNPNDINPAATTINLYTGVTVGTLGSLTTAIAYSEGATSNQGQGRPAAEMGEELVMAPNTTYILRITSLDLQPQNVTSYISWYEGQTDLPI